MLWSQCTPVTSAVLSDEPVVDDPVMLFAEALMIKERLEICKPICSHCKFCVVCLKQQRPALRLLLIHFLACYVGLCASEMYASKI